MVCFSGLGGFFLTSTRAGPVVALTSSASEWKAGTSGELGLLAVLAACQRRKSGNGKEPGETP